MQRILHYDGLYRETAASPAPDYLFSELLETRSRGFDWVVEPHVHAHLLQVFFVETGQVLLHEEGRQRELAAPVALLIPPATLHGFTYQPGTTGRILTLATTLVESLFAGAAPLLPLLGGLRCLSRFAEPYSAAQVGALLAAIDQEFNDHQPEKRLMLRAYLQQLMLVLLRLWQQEAAPADLPGTPALHHFRRFQQRIKQAGATYNVTQLADELALTPAQLNRICRTVAGKSAGRLVQEQLLHEARKYLTYTTHSVSEIAYLLHFEYPTYFARFFKKHTGLSPTDFRARPPG